MVSCGDSAFHASSNAAAAWTWPAPAVTVAMRIRMGSDSAWFQHAHRKQEAESVGKHHTACRQPRFCSCLIQNSYNLDVTQNVVAMRELIWRVSCLYFCIGSRPLN